MEMLVSNLDRVIDMRARLAYMLKVAEKKCDEVEAKFYELDADCYELDVEYRKQGAELARLIAQAKTEGRP